MLIFLNLSVVTLLLQITSGTIPITLIADVDSNENETMVITLDAPYASVSKSIRIFDQ